MHPLSGDKPGPPNLCVTGTGKGVKGHCPAQATSSWGSKALEAPIPSDTRLPAHEHARAQHRHTSNAHAHVHVCTYTHAQLPSPEEGLGRVQGTVRRTQCSPYAMSFQDQVAVRRSPQAAHLIWRCNPSPRPEARAAPSPLVSPTLPASDLLQTTPPRSDIHPYQRPWL